MSARETTDLRQFLMEVVRGSMPAHLMDWGITSEGRLKRKHVSPEGEDNDEGRKRGRPRVDPQSQSAADVCKPKAAAISDQIHIAGVPRTVFILTDRYSDEERKFDWRKGHTGSERSLLWMSSADM